jgi:hypothetical protein
MQKTDQVRVLYCRRPDEPAWAEQLLTDRPELLTDARAWAEARGYIVREATIDLSTPPDFARALD